MMHPNAILAEAHRTELLAVAAEDRVAKQARQHRGNLRHRTGHALVRLGHKLADL